MLQKLKKIARALKSDLIALYLSYRDPRVAWYAKLFTLGVVSYAFSPVDFIPDFIPVLGYVDDLVIVPLGIFLALKMVPNAVIEENRVKAQHMLNKPRNWIAASLIMAIWLIAGIWLTVYVYRSFFG